MEGNQSNTGGLSEAGKKWLALLVEDMQSSDYNRDHGRLNYIGTEIFNFDTGEGFATKLFAQKALEVCLAINNRTTFKYIEKDESRIWFLLMINMPFFQGRLSSGVSVRSSWWESDQSILINTEAPSAKDNLISYDRVEYKMTNVEWCEFIKALCVFSTFDEGNVQALNSTKLMAGQTFVNVNRQLEFR